MNPVEEGSDGVEGVDDAIADRGTLEARPLIDVDVDGNDDVEEDEDVDEVVE